jgi:hypothetical protein
MKKWKKSKRSRNKDTEREVRMHAGRKREGEDRDAKEEGRSGGMLILKVTFFG